MQAIRTRYINPTNSHGARVQAKCDGRTIYIDYPHELSGDDVHKAACNALLQRMGWTTASGYTNVVGGSIASDMFWVFMPKEIKINSH